MRVGVVVRGIGGCVALSRMVSFVVQPLSTILTCHMQFFGSCHPLRMVSPLRVTSEPCLWKKTSHLASQRTGTKRRLLIRLGSRWARRTSAINFVSRRSTAWVDVILAPLGWRTVICTLVFVVLVAGAFLVSSVTEAALLMKAVDSKSVGLVQPDL
jgi:hypothetical protein